MSAEIVDIYNQYKIDQQSELVCKKCWIVVHSWITGSINSNEIKKIKRKHCKECK